MTAKEAAPTVVSVNAPPGAKTTVTSVDLGSIPETPRRRGVGNVPSSTLISGGARTASERLVRGPRLLPFPEQPAAHFSTSGAADAPVRRLPPVPTRGRGMTA
ncbi:hypothetical protein GCM10010390_62000 [Streptomyces mordarskii]|uniref:Uncharacterized protein n=1 Tax=Streptomyces mordarskii TaxID=1226758 RepID=A0ABP3NUB0_9ACTN